MKIVLGIGGVWALSNYIVLFKRYPGGGGLSIESEGEDNIARTAGLFGGEDKILKRMFNGYQARLSEDTVKRLSKDPLVEVVEEDQKIRIASFEIEGRISYDLAENAEFGETFMLQKNAPWGISRISGHDDDYEYIKGGGMNVNVYVLDTGVDVNHAEFSGRASWGYNAVENSPDKDEHGHGTHCAGTIGGKTFGIAKDSRIIAVKVLNSNGEGMISSMIEGIEYIVKDHKKNLEQFYRTKERSTKLLGNFILNLVNFRFFGPFIPHGWKLPLRRLDRRQSTGGVLESDSPPSEAPKAVVNMSVGGSKSHALNFAIKYATTHMGIHFSTAAGNEHQNACKFSPASSGDSMTVGASDRNNLIAPFSNVGECVSIYAPGTEILSAWPGNKAKIASGTSMATPHVTGIMAVYASLAHFTPRDLKIRLIKDSEPLIKEDASFTSSFWSLKSHSDPKPMASLRKLFQRLKTP